ncbi:MAG: hypothetical protein RLZZ245_927 [Verrucomicrobiota bacterium]|jgi:hypothetical protein
MTQAYQEDRIRFEFPDGWEVLRPEKASYYTRRFQSFAGGCKEMDFILFDPVNRVLWFLEVKDYTTNPRIKKQCVFEEIAEKIRDSLALLLAGSVREDPSNGGVRSFMDVCAIPNAIKIVLHLEQPLKPSKMFPGVKIEADATQKLRAKVKAVDPRARVSSTSSTDMEWRAIWSP